MKYFLCKYIPPRPDFLSTMSPEERALMKRHGEYLNELLARNIIVAHGPVMDPASSYGVSLYQFGDEEDISAFTAEDPVVKNGVGLYEHYAMLSLSAKS